MVDTDSLVTSRVLESQRRGWGAGSSVLPKALLLSDCRMNICCLTPLHLVVEFQVLLHKILKTLVFFLFPSKLACFERALRRHVIEFNMHAACIRTYYAYGIQPYNYALPHKIILCIKPMWNKFNTIVACKWPWILVSFN